MAQRMYIMSFGPVLRVVASCKSLCSIIISLIRIKMSHIINIYIRAHHECRSFAGWPQVPA